jgi:ERCC4-type nuclease
MIGFRLWSPPDNPALARVYVSGLPGVEKTFLARKRGGSVMLSGDATQWPTVLASLHLLGVKGDDPTVLDWSEIVQAVEGQVKSPSRPRGAPAAVKCETTGKSLGRATSLVRHPSTADLDLATIPVPVEGIDIVVDHREPAAIVALLKQAPNTRVTVESLAVGDYRVGSVIIERKTAHDFEVSVQDGRLFDEATRINHEHAVGIVIVEGDVFGQRQSLLIQSVTGALTCLSKVQSMSVWQTVDYVHTAYSLIKIAQHSLFGLGYDLPLHRSKPKALVDARAYLVQALPCVSGANAASLLAHFGTVREVMAATRSDLLKVKGIGPKSADRIVELLDAR